MHWVLPLSFDTGLPNSAHNLSSESCTLPEQELAKALATVYNPRELLAVLLIVCFRQMALPHYFKLG